MSADLVVLTRREPDCSAVLDGLVALGEPWVVRGARVFDREGRLLVSVEEPVLVSVPGELERLLGGALRGWFTEPVWWVDVRAVVDVPGAVEAGRTFAEALVRWAGGTVWPELPPESSGKSWRAVGAE